MMALVRNKTVEEEDMLFKDRKGWGWKEKRRLGDDIRRGGLEFEVWEEKRWEDWL